VRRYGEQFLHVFDRLVLQGLETGRGTSGSACL
jgi:hypothetical protein